MPEVLEAFAARQRAEQEAQETARLIRWRADAVLGRAILAEQDSGTPQGEIARKIGRTREQVRRYQVAYRDWLKEHDGQEPEPATDPPST
jgi:predicted transcriptional regulator